MRRSFAPLLVAVALGAGWFAPQDPVPGKQVPVRQAPGGQTAGAPPAGEPAPGEPPHSRFEGVYRLKARVVDGRTDTNPHHGFLGITRKHLFLTLAAPGPRAGNPLIHSSVRQWREEQGSVHTVIDIDVWTDGAGNIHLEPAGKHERRRFELVRGGIRVLQDDRTWLEFERVD